MTHPIPPPEPPAIVQKLSPQTHTADRNALSDSLSVNQSLDPNSLSSSASVQSLNPTPAPANTAKSAAFLGAEMKVGYAVEEFAIADLPDISLNQTATASQEKAGGAGEAVEAEGEKSLVSSSPQASFPSAQRNCPLARNRTKAISPFRPSNSVLVNKLLMSQATAPGIDAGSNNTSQSPNPPLELDFRAPSGETQPQPSAQPPKPIQPTPPGTAPARRRIVEVNSDRQVYDEQRQIVTAEGNVVVRIEDAILDADRLQVSLTNLIAVGEGNVAFTRGKQVLRGQRFTFNIVQNSGNIQGGRGDIFVPTAGADFSDTLATDVSAGGVFSRPPSDRFTSTQPLQQVSSPGGINFTLGGGRNIQNITGAKPGGQVNRLRFEADRINFYPQGWQAKDVRITNDPYSPPELELRADTVTLTRETPLRDRVRTRKQRLVFDQGFSLPIPRNQAVIDRTQRNTSPGIVQFGYDAGDRGGFYIERDFSFLDSPAAQLSIRPQFFVQKAVSGNDGNVAGLFGLKANLRANPSARSAITGYATFTSLDFSEIEDNLRANLLLQQQVGTRYPHTVALQAAYRERIYNGSLGYRTVQSSIGGSVTSPVIPLGKTGINLSYQAGYQYINAATDRLELLERDRSNDRISLGRFQGTFALNRGFSLWQGKALPATRTEGLKYTPAPVVPYLAAYGGITGTSSFYSNGDNQSLLIGTIGLSGQFGHFSRPFLDYTAFNISYSEGIRSGISPFYFDRAEDTRTLGLGLTQQIYGPFRLGFQTAINLDTKETFTTDYILEYSRRTYGILLRYNPDQEIGSISFRLSDFNWSGSTDPFNDEVRPVFGGVER